MYEIVKELFTTDAGIIGLLTFSALIYIVAWGQYQDGEHYRRQRANEEFLRRQRNDHDQA
jgi:hypothetical protein